MAGLLALGSTIVALIVVNIVVSGLSISGFSTYAYACLIIWLTTVAGDMVGRSMIRARTRRAAVAKRANITLKSSSVPCQCTQTSDGDSDAARGDR